MPAPLTLSDQRLADLERQWRAQRAPIAERLQPGLSEDEQQRLLAPLGLRLPIEARAWWGWHDGAAGSSADRALGPFFPHLSLAEAVGEYRRVGEAAAEVARTPGQPAPLSTDAYWWAPQWFPVTRTDYGGVVACDCSVEEGAPTPIRMVWWAGRESFAEPVTRSFGEMVSFWIDALETGVWRYDARAGEWRADHALLGDPSRALTRLV